MADSRVPLSRLDPNVMSFGRERQPTNGITILRDEEEAGIGIPFRWGATPFTGVTGGPLGLATTRGRGGGRVERGAIAARPGRGGRGGRGQGRGRGTDLPSWFPRRPLGDITTIQQAIERRRARLNEHEEDPQNDRPIPPQDQIPHEPLLRDVFEQSHSLNHSNTEGRDGNSTPEPLKHHLSHIDSVEKSVLEEIRRLKSTPSAKKAERVRKMKALMSMR